MDDAIKRAKAYSQTKHSILIAEVIAVFIFFILFQWLGLSAKAAEAASGLFVNSYAGCFFYMLGIGVLLEGILFPLAVTNYQIDRRYSMSNQTFILWLKDYVKGLTLSGVYYLIMFSILYYLLRRSFSAWWLYGTLAYGLIHIVLARIFPIFIIPLFFKLERMPDNGVRQRLVNLIKKAGGIHILDIYMIGLGEKTKKANAALCGLGATKRILLSDTLLAAFSEDEIEATLAHEVAHHKHNHIWKLYFWNFILTLLGFYAVAVLLRIVLQRGYIEPIYDLQFFPVAAMVIMAITIICTPLLAYISRRYEAEADLEAVRLTNKRDVLMDLLRKLSLQNLSDPRPNALIKYFFYNHPPLDERLRIIMSGYL